MEYVTFFWISFVNIWCILGFAFGLKKYQDVCSAFGSLSNALYEFAPIEMQNGIEEFVDTLGDRILENVLFTMFLTMSTFCWVYMWIRHQK